MLPNSLCSLISPRLPDSCCFCSFAATKIAFNVALSWASDTDYLHHGSRHLLPPAYLVTSCAQTSNMGRVTTHSATVTWLLSMYFLNSCFSTAYSMMSAPYLRQYLSCCRIFLFPVTCCKNPVCTPSILVFVKYLRTHLSAPKIRIVCTTAW